MGEYGGVSSARAVLLVFSLWSARLAAQPLGDGRHGALEVVAQGTVINRATPLLADAAAGASALEVADAMGLAPGDLLLLVQSQALADGDRAAVGTFALHQVRRVVATHVELAAPLARTWRAGEAQAVTVPQYTAVTVTAEGALVAPPWDGASGGVLALLAQGEVRNDGAVSASGRGLRGGVSREVSQLLGCSDLDEPAPRGGERGEGVRRGGYGPTATGRRENDSGGGGNVCGYSGGGGGASLGAGGQGGASSDGVRDVGGLGGLALDGGGLVFGGGGGAANGSFSHGTRGGAGGGAVYVRAASLTGSGRLEADGEASAPARGDFGGAGGAGAGGSVVVELTGEARCQLSARGGIGGDGTKAGPGGGGGGGFVSLRATQADACPASVAGGAAGQVGGAPLGAVAGQPGAAVVEVHEGAMDFPSGPGFGLHAAGCGCQVAAPGWLLLAAGALLWRGRRRA